MQNILIRSLSRSLSLVLSHLPPWNTLQIDWFLLHFCTRFVLLWAENMLSLHIFSTLWHQPFMCSFCCCCCSMRLLPWCLLFTYALFHVLFDAIQSSVMHFYDTFEIFCSAAVCSLTHTHTHTLNLPLMPRVSRCTSVYSRCSCAFFTHSQIENVRPHFQLYHIISYSCCALDLFLPFFFLLLSISFTICCNIRHSLWHSVSILFCCSSSALFIFYWNWKVFVLR